MRTTLILGKHHLALLETIPSGHVGVSPNDHVEDTMWAIDDSVNPDIEIRAKKLCYTWESPVRKQWMYLRRRLRS